MVRTLRIFAEQELALALLPVTERQDVLAIMDSTWSTHYADIKDKQIPLLVLYFAEGGSFNADDWQGFDFLGWPKHTHVAAQLNTDQAAISQTTCPAFALRLSAARPDNSAVCALFNMLLVYGRPLEHYGCTFYLPVYADKPLATGSLPISPLYQVDAKVYGGTAVSAKSNAEAQSYLYFQPPIRDFLFDTEYKSPSPEPIKEWRLQPKADSPPWLLELQLRENRLNSDGSPVLTADGTPVIEVSHELSATISQVALYQYFNHLCVLAVSVEPSTPFSAYRPGDKDDWWHILAFCDDSQWQLIECLQLGLWLRFTKSARILFASFVEQEDELKIDEVVLKGLAENTKKLVAESCRLKIEPIKETLENHPIAFLLECFFGNSENPLYFDKTYHHFYDDRLFVNAAYGYAGGQLAGEVADKVFSLALYVDAPRDAWSKFGGYAYDPEFVRDLMAKHSSGRWRGLGTYAGFTHYANVHLGAGRFFCKVIAPIHVPLIYGRMLLIALFYQASLRYYRDRLMKLASQQVDKISSENVQALRKEFMLFTNAYWFREVTSQIQGREVFAMQQQALELQRDYEFIKEEMERLDAYMQGQLSNELNASSHQLNQYSLKLNRVVFWFTAISLCFAYTQIIFDHGILSQTKSWLLKLGFSDGITDIARWFVSNVQGITIFFSTLAFVVIACLPVKYLINWLFRRKAN